MQVQFGVDIFLTSGAVSKQVPIALVTNNAATTSCGVASRVALLENGFNLRKLFSPEHGISAAGEDGTFQDNSIDHITGLPVISLYGDRLAPVEKDLADVGICVFDIPDVGCRFYTYLWTMTYVMEACAKFNIPFVVLDRPNPTGCDLSMAEGPMLDEQTCSSFIGRWRIPVKHSCTLGELALYFAATKTNQLDIDIVKAGNYHRPNTAGNFLFVPTSPAIMNPVTAMLYPGMGLLEGVNLNEGRGTGKPFQILGAPWIDSHTLCAALVEAKLPGVDVFPISFRAATLPYNGEMCHGIELTIRDPLVFHPVATTLAILRVILQGYPQQLIERAYVTHVNPAGSGHLDKLLGVKDAFIKLRCGENIDTILGNSWENIMTPFLLY